MKAIFKTKPQLGGSLRECPIPEPKRGEVLIKVRATSICGTDVHIYEWNPWAEQRIGAKALPQIMGHEMAGDVVAVGENVQRINVGDYVSVETHIYDPGDLEAMLGLLHIGPHMKIVGVDANGCFGEYFTVPEIVCWVNDPSIPPEIATIQEPLGNAIYALLGEDNDIAGKTLTVVGDGPIAMFAVAVARVCGATPIFVIGMSPFNLDICRKLGADHIIPLSMPAAERAQYIRDHTRGAGSDIVLEMVGAPQSIHDALTVVRRGGRVSAFGVAPDAAIPMDYTNGIVFKGCQIHGITGRKIFDTWYRGRNLLASGRLDIRPVITHLLPLDDFAVGFDALLAKDRRAGKVVLFPNAEELAAARTRFGQ